MTGAAVLRAGRTRAGLAQSQGARGWAHRQRSSVPLRVRQPPLPRPVPSRSGVLATPRRLRPGRPLAFTGRLRHQPGLEGSPAVKGTQEALAWGSAGSRVGASRRMSRRLGEETDRQRPDLHPRNTLGPAPILSSLLPQPPLWSVPNANFMPQNLSAVVWKPDPLDAGRGWPR